MKWIVSGCVGYECRSGIAMNPFLPPLPSSDGYASGCSG